MARGNRKVFCAFYQKILVPLRKNRLAVQRLEITNLFLCAICIHKVLTKQEYHLSYHPRGMLLKHLQKFSEDPETLFCFEEQNNFFERKSDSRAKMDTTEKFIKG